MSVSRRAGAARPGTRRTGRVPFRPGATRSRAGRSPDGAGTPAGSPLTTRAAILLLVVVTLAVSLALPLQQFLAQRSQIAGLEAQGAAANARVAELEQAKRQLADPAYIAAEARRRLHMAKPGEITYLVIGPSPAPTAAPAPGVPAGPPAPPPDAPWWSQIWAGIAAADQPVPPAK